LKKNTAIIVGIIVVIVLLVGGYLIFHKSNKTNTAYSNSSTQASKSSSSQSTAPAVNNSVMVTKTASGVGQYLADPSGKALYTYGGDTNGVSNCTGSCLASWPAYQATGSTSNLPNGVAVITRTDNGQKQYTYNGMPLYFFASDTNGQVTGNGVANFQVAKPTAASSSSSSSSSSSTQSTTPAPSSSSSSGYPY
jgi:predicted lipoprotein with Yx(FWY)xxD motif